MEINNFVYYNPTRIYFGNEQIEKIGGEAAQHGKRAALVYGGGSIKRNGIYDIIADSLKAAGVEVYDCAGVEPNPQYTTVNRCAQSAGTTIVMSLWLSAAVQ